MNSYSLNVKLLGYGYATPDDLAPGVSFHSKTITMDYSQYPVPWSLASLCAFPDLPVSRYSIHSMTSHPGFSLGSAIIATGSSPRNINICSLGVDPGKTHL